MSQHPKKQFLLPVIILLYVTVFSGCDIQKKYSSEIFKSLTVPEEGGIKFTQLTKTEDIVKGPATKIVKQTVKQGNIIKQIDVLRWSTATFLSISPDGKMFTFLGNNNNSDNLFVRSTSGGAGSTQRTFRNNVYDFCYSPDGKTLAFSEFVGTGTGGNYNIYSINVNRGNAVRQIASTAADEFNSVFTDDSKTIFYSNGNSGNYNIWSLDLNTGLRTQYSDGFNPCIMPNTNSKELFICRNAKNSVRSEIWKLNIENGSETQYIADPNRSFSSPKVSPDGKYILVTASTPKSTVRPQNLDLYLFNIDGTGETQLTFHPGLDASAIWSPSGKEIYFISSRGFVSGDYNVWRMNIENIIK